MKKLILIFTILLWALPLYATCNFYVGFFGQSNGGQMTCKYEDQTDGCTIATANPNVYMWWNNTKWISPGKGSGSGSDSAGLVAFGNAINNATGCNVYMVDVAFGSSSIFASTNEGFGWWWDDLNDTTSSTYNTNYTTQKAIITAATGGHLDAIILMNGDGEGFRVYNSACPSSTCTNGTPPRPNTWNQAWYTTHYTAFLNQLRSDFGNVPIIQSQLATCTTYGNKTGFDTSWSNVREFNKTAIANFTHAYIGDTTVNFALASGGMHWTAAGYAQAGLELAQAFLYDKGYVTWYKGPTITGLNAVDSTHTDIIIQHSGGNDFTPTTGIGGFALTCGGSAVTINSAVRETSTSIRLNHGVCTGTREATYMYGVAPLTYGTGNAGTPVTDNSTLYYALEPNINITQVSGTTYTISGTINGTVQ